MKRLFHRLSDREKIIVLSFIFCLLVFWSLWWTVRMKKFFAEWEQARTDLVFQASILDQGPDLEAQLRYELSKIDPSKTLDAVHLVGRVDKMAREAQLFYELGSPKSKPGDMLDIYTVVINIKQAPLAQLVNFDNLLAKDFPYLSLSNMRLTAVPNNPNLLDATLTIVSFEVKDMSLF